MAVGEDETITLGLDVLALDASPAVETGHVNLVIEVTDVSDNGVVLHLGHVGCHDDVLVASGGDEDVTGLEHILKGCNLVALHACLQRADGVNLSHDDTCAGCLHGRRATLAHISVACDEGDLARNHNVGGAHDAVGQGVAATVHVVELGLGDRVVHVDSREQELALVLHLIQALHTSGGLLAHAHNLCGHLGPALGVLGKAITDDAQHNLELVVVSAVRVGHGAVLGEGSLSLHALMDEESGVTAVINKHVGAVTLGPCQGHVSAPPVLLKGLALPCEHGR
mmetsp:Transcript_16337/g.28014  ORF Transcript_16337/g.28014 Transcript_16337/m.28014 type:complete len:282 (+) Transcript_16337:2014-2859(+)